MKTLIILSAITLPLALAAAQLLGQAADNPPKRTLYHVVSFKFKPTATPEQIKAVETAFAELKDRIPTITSLHWGTNVSPEKHDKGFTHCFILTFASEKDRDDYLPHPAHKAFGKVLGPVLADVFVIDFWSQGE
jgi:hypothetical protein